MQKIINAIAVIAAVAILCSPALAADDEAVAQKIYTQIQAALKGGADQEACNLALKMAPYEGTAAYDEAKKELLGHGISIEDPLYSYSIKKMIDLQNQLEAQRARTGTQPRLGPQAAVRDGWNRPVRVELLSTAAFAYIIRSAGPDGRFFTGDDLVIGTRDKKKGGDRKKAPQAEVKKEGDVLMEEMPSADAVKAQPQPMATGAVSDMTRDQGKSSLMHGRRNSSPEGLPMGGPSSAEGKRGAPMEREITIEELETTLGL